MENKVVSLVLDDSTIETIIIVTFSCTKLSSNGLHLDRRIEEERSNNRTQLSLQPSIVFAETKKKFLSGISGCFDSMRSVHCNASFWIDDKRCSRSSQGFDDHLSDTLTFKVFNNSLAIDGFRGDKADELVLNGHVNVGAHSSSSCCSDGPVDEIISSGCGFKLSTARIAGRHVWSIGRRMVAFSPCFALSAASAPRNR